MSDDLNPDPDRTLWTTTKNSQTNVYHLTPECPRLDHPTTRVREITLRKNPFLEPCSWCAENGDAAAEYGRQGAAE